MILGPIIHKQSLATLTGSGDWFPIGHRPIAHALSIQ